jgi:two-component system nitrogen regulation response regulator NtrX
MSAPVSPPLATDYVVVVDPDEELRRLLADVLADEGIVCLGAGDLVAASAAVYGIAPGAHLIAMLCDGSIAKRHDFGGLMELRLLAPHSPVVVMHSFPTPMQQDACYAHGAVAVVSKPLDLDELNDCLTLVRRTFSPA